MSQLSTGLALVALVASLLHAGATAVVDANVAAFVVSSPNRRLLHHDHHHAALLQDLLLSTGRHRRSSMSSLAGDKQTWCSQQHTAMRRMGAAERAGAMMALPPKTRRCRVFVPLGAAAAAAAGSSSSSSALAAGARAWESSGVSGDSGVDRTAVYAEARRAPNIRGQMMEILRPDLPRVRIV